MVWFRVDDRFHSSRKVKRIPRPLRLECIGLWTIAGSWSASENLDGFVPEYMIEDFGGTPEQVSALVEAGLWEVAEEGTRFYKWTEYNPDAASIEAAKDAQSEGAKHANHKRWHAKRGVRVPDCRWCVSPASPPDQVPDQYTESYPNPPGPARPEPIPTETSVENVSVGRGSGGKRGTRIPTPFILTAPMREWAATTVPAVDVDNATQKFVDYWRAESGAKATKLDWVAAWRYWLRNDNDRSKPGKAAKPSRVEQNVAEYQRLYGGDHERTGSLPALDAGVGA